MAAEGAIAVKKMILSVFFKFYNFFLWRCFQNCATWEVDWKKQEEMWFYITWSNWYFQIKLGNYVIMGDVRLK